MPDTAPHIYQANATQMRDIADYMDSLNAAEALLSQRKHPDLGDGEGVRAVLLEPIPVRTDLRGESGVLGWLRNEEFGWAFSTTPPK